MHAAPDQHGVVAALNLYPLKSGAQLEVRTARVQPEGFAADRRVMAVGMDGMCLTARTCPRLMRIHCVIEETLIVLQAPHMSPLTVDSGTDMHTYLPVKVWDDEFMGLTGSFAADRWLSEFLQVECRLVMMGKDTRRTLAMTGEGFVNFADAAPLLLTSNASLADLNARLLRPVEMGRFRANIVIDGERPFSEDRWTRIRIGEVEFDALGLCDRCSMVTLDPAAPEQRLSSEPMKTLGTYRQAADGRVYFGQLLKPRSSGRIHVGDPVVVLASTGPPRFNAPTANDTNFFLPVAQLKAATPASSNASPLQLHCVAIREETHDVRTFQFRPVANEGIRYDAGQFITLEVPVDGTIEQRCYSLSSSPSRPELVAITVKRVADGKISNWLHDHLQIGDTLAATTVGGAFSFAQHPARKVLMLSAGSGITPLISMLRWIADRALPVDILFHHSAHTAADIIFASELQYLEKALPQMKLSFNLTREAVPDDQSFHAGRIDSAMLQAIAPDIDERLVFCCGPDGFRSTVKDILRNRPGFDLSRLLEESFGVRGPLPSSETPQAFEVFFARSNRTVRGEVATPLVNVAKQAGLLIRSACEVGLCGTCKCRLLSGDWTLSPWCADPSRAALTDSEKSEGYVLTCSTCPQGKVIVDL